MWVIWPRLLVDVGLTHLALASDTLILGLSRSSLRRSLCSVSLRSLSSDIDCLWCRDEFMFKAG